MQISTVFLLRNLTLAVCVGLCVAFFAGVVAADEVTFSRGNTAKQLSGEILVEAQDGGVLFLANDGRLWLIQADEIKSKVDNDTASEPLSKKEIGEHLLKELPDGFRLYNTKHYVVAYETNKTYARWVGGLYEKLHKGFDKFWKNDRQLELTDPPFPMVAIIFDTKASYARYVKNELGEEPGMVAYYNLETNRVAMYDLTAAMRASGRNDNRKVNEILNTANSVPMVATIIHEGTHQQIFNRGLQTRLADTPLWLNEGLAMFVETPDLKQSAGWKGIGKPNPLRYPRFINSLRNRGSNSLESLVADNTRFQNAETMLDAYAECWALNYFLINQHPEKYVAYVKELSQKEPLVEDSRQQRLEQFKKHFGDDLTGLDREFILYMRKIQ